MAGTIVVDRIESDASYTSTINVANRITFSNTVNFGVFAGTAPVAGFYLPTTNNLAFTTASTERMRIDSSGNVGVGTSSPSYRIHVANSSATSTTLLANILARLQSNASGADASLQFSDNITNSAGISLNQGSLVTSIAGGEVMRVNTSGNVGIGTSSMSNRLEVVQSASADASAAIRAGTNGYAASLKLIANDATGSRYNTLNSFYGSTEQWSIRSGAADSTMTFCTGSSVTERMRIDSSGNVGIGQTSMASDTRLHLTKTTDNCIVKIQSSFGAELQLINGGGSELSVINATGNNVLVLRTGSIERMRIDTGGNLQLGSTSPPEAGRLFVSSTSASAVPFVLQQTAAGSTTQNSVVFYRNSGSTGTIQVTGTTTAYNTSSDYRLKENVQPMTGALAKVTAMKPCTYTWKLDGSLGEGFIAHELAEVVPQAVGGEKDAVNADGKIIPQGIDTSFLVATLTAAIQEQQALITSLTARITTLESN
jgi:hypothetical protein